MTLKLELLRQRLEVFLRSSPTNSDIGLSRKSLPIDVQVEHDLYSAQCFLLQETIGRSLYSKARIKLRELRDSMEHSFSFFLPWWRYSRSLLRMQWLLFQPALQSQILMLMYGGFSGG